MLYIIYIYINIYMLHCLYIYIYITLYRCIKIISTNTCIYIYYTLQVKPLETSYRKSGSHVLVQALVQKGEPVGCRHTIFPVSLSNAI